MFVAATSSPVRRRALNPDVFQMTGSCSTVAVSASRLDRAASKGTSWAAGSCFHVTSARTAQVSIVSNRVMSYLSRAAVIPTTCPPSPSCFSVRRDGWLGLRRESQTQRGSERHVRQRWRGGGGRGGRSWGFGRQKSRGKVARAVLIQYWYGCKRTSFNVRLLLKSPIWTLR